ncbi:MAG: dephospho-CoA kinase [Verrucomicrobia bacterium]|nr:dephospho-CoA kinase [Verrucomicrobiota bacterium]
MLNAESRKTFTNRNHRLIDPYSLFTCDQRAESDCPPFRSGVGSGVPAIGVTGGIATGKSSFVRCLRELLPDARFFDADEMARSLTRTDAAVLADIRRQFGPGVFHASGELNRAALRAIVFGAREKRRVLEEILHPRIRQHWSGEAEKYRSSRELFVADIPLLYEIGGEKLCSAVVTVACSEEIQLERLMARVGMDRAAAAEMIGAQMPMNEKLQRADHVVWNNGRREGLMAQARLLIDLWTRIP